MYVIVEINGQQFKAEQGKKLFVHHIKNSQEGQAVEFEKVLLVDKDGSVEVGAPTVEGAKVVCEVINPLVKGDKVIVKSNASYFVIDLAARTYAVLSSADRSVDYGEYPARAGECDQFVTFSTVKDVDTGYPTSVNVRTFRL